MNSSRLIAFALGPTKTIYHIVEKRGDLVRRSE